MINSISEITKLWDKALKAINNKLNDRHTFESFFEGTYIHDIKGDTIIVSTTTKLASTLLRTKHSEFVESVIYEITDQNYHVDFVFEEELAKREQPQETKTVYNNKESNYFKHSKLNPKCTFDNYVVGPFNREVSQAGLIISKNPGTMFNPLFIYSNSGLGKTHLLNAVGNQILKDNKNANILYITANDFVEEYIKYVRADKDSESLKDYFKTVDVLLFDDVQFLADKVKTEEMFFYIYSWMINEGKQIIITSDKQPIELRNLEDRLVTRFSQGLVVKIDEPDTETCVQILKKKVAASGFGIQKIDDEVLEFFAEKYSRNVRELEGAINRLIFYATSIKQTDVVTMDIAIEASGSILGGKSISTQLTEEKIINIVADYYNITPTQIKGKIRTGQIALARHIAMWLIRDILGVSLKKIGACFGGKDHTTVMNAVSKVDKELITDNALKAAIDELRARIKK